MDEPEERREPETEQGGDAVEIVLPKFDCGRTTARALPAGERHPDARTIQDVTQPLARSFGLKEPTGALVSSVDPKGAGVSNGRLAEAVNGPAADAGISHRSTS